MEPLSGNPTQSHLPGVSVNDAKKQAQFLEELNDRVKSAAETAQNVNKDTFIPSMTKLHTASRNAWVKGDVRATLQNALKIIGVKDRQLIESKLVPHEALVQGFGNTMTQEAFSNDAVAKKMAYTFTVRAAREFAQEKIQHLLPHAQIEEFGAIATSIDEMLEGNFKTRQLDELVTTARELNNSYKAFNASPATQNMKIAAHQQVIFNYDPTNSEHLKGIEKLKSEAKDKGLEVIDVFAHEGLKIGAVALVIEHDPRFPIGLPSGANVVILSENDKMLLVLDKAKRTWMFPGGKVEENQNHVQAAMAELEQEAGIKGQKITDKDLISAKAFPHHQLPGGTRCPALNKIYGLYIDHLDPKQLENFDREEISEVRLVSLADLKDAKQLADQNGTKFNLAFDVQGIAKEFHDSKVTAGEALLEKMQQKASGAVQAAEALVEKAKGELMQSNAEFLRSLHGT